MPVTKSYSIPEDVAKYIDSLPKRERSKFVASTLRRAIQKRTAQKTLDMLAGITPVEGIDDKDSVELVNEARNTRRKKILHNVENNGG